MKIFSILMPLVLAAVIFFLFLFLYLNTFLKNQTLTSPLPSFLTLFKNSEVSSLNLWFPNLDNKAKVNIKKPDITAKSALVYDLTTNQTLFSKNPKEKLPMASLTKIMTVVIALEHKKPGDRYLVKAKDLVGEDSMGLSDGEVMSFNDLLYGLILHSGNDAAEVLADNYKGGRTKFIKLMNKKAESLGLFDTNFTNPTGLEGHNKQYTTAYDLLVITNYAMRFPIFKKIVSTVKHYIAKTSFHKEYLLNNETNLLTSYPGVKGVKTGYTPEAGLCLITYLDYKGHKIIGILLGSDNRRQEMKELLDYSLKSLGITPPPHG